MWHFLWPISVTLSGTVTHVRHNTWHSLVTISCDPFQNSHHRCCNLWTTCQAKAKNNHTKIPTVPKWPEIEAQARKVVATEEQPSLWHCSPRKWPAMPLESGFKSTVWSFVGAGVAGATWDGSKKDPCNVRHVITTRVFFVSYFSHSLGSYSLFYRSRVNIRWSRPCTGFWLWLGQRGPNGHNPMELWAHTHQGTVGSCCFPLISIIIKS